MPNFLKRAGLIVVHISGVKALWEEIGAEATLLLSAGWLIVSTTGWVWYSACASDWPKGSAITFASDTLGAILGTVAVGTLSMEVAVVLVKLIMDGRREQDWKKVEQAQREADEARQETRAWREWARKNDIDLPPHLESSTEPVESAE